MGRKKRSTAEPYPPRNTITAELPSDILFSNILPRLPARSLLRFNCVSKQWHSLIKTSMFAQTHLHYVTNNHHQNHEKLLVLSAKTPLVFHTLDCEAPENGLTPSRSLPFEAGSPQNITNLTSFGGLVCVGINCWYGYEYCDLILWNPLTGEYKKLAKNSYHKHCGTAYGLYYSSCDDDYKLLHVPRDSHAYVYSLKSDTWRKVDSIGDFKHKVNNWISQVHGPSIWLNGKLYFLEKAGGLSSTVIKFDTETEKFTEIATPSYGEGFTVAVKGCIHYYMNSWVVKKNHDRALGVELWRMDGDGDWTMVFVRDWDDPGYISCDFQQPLHIMRNGNWLMGSVHSNYPPFGVYQVYNMKNHAIGVYQVDNMKNHAKYVSSPYTAHCKPDIYPQGKYIETLVSPYMK